MAGPFDDGRLGLWIVDVERGMGRLAAIRAKLPRVTDLFLPGSQATKAHKSAVLEAGFTGCHGWWAVDSATAADYARRVLADIARWNPGAGDLNIELGSDAALNPFIRTTLGVLRAARPRYRFRLNVATRKAGFLPIDTLQLDPNLYACEGSYFGNMDARYSEADALDDLLAAGVPRDKASVCYAAACTVGGVTGAQRVNLVPIFWPPRRGVIFQDDLCVEGGIL